MEYKQFGSTGLLVSEMGLGTAQIGGPSIIRGRPLGSKSITDNEAYKILSLAADAGINFYDSSDKYGDGLAEKRLGEFFRGSQDIVVATKCGFDESGGRKFSKKYITDALEGSLKRLKRDCVDIFQLTKPSLEDAEKERLSETVGRLKKGGKIRFAGISVGTLEDGMGFLKEGMWDSFQIIYNALTLEYKGMIREAAEKKRGVIARSPLSSGMLTGKFTKSSTFRGSDDRASYLHGRLLEQRCENVRRIKEKYGLDNEGLTMFSLNFLLSDPDVSTVIPGATSALQMAVNLKAVEKKRFSFSEWNGIFDFLKKTNETVSKNT